METYRLGQSMVDVIKAVLPELEDMVSKRKSDILFLPVILEKSEEWVYHLSASESKSGREVARDKDFFSLRWLKRADTDLQEGLVVMAFYNVLLDNVK
eukprot:2652341-Karenia_brevis.AAC.1